MPTSKTSLDFKLIAVRVLSGCVQHIRKCLVENHFYYLNNDYRISEDGKLITRQSSNIAPLSANFFSLSEKQSKGVRLNFSAIVGMNGDGKSSLVELIIRILNNASIIHEIGEIGTLLWIQGVNAELYYHLDGIFYRLVTTEDDARIYRYVETGNVYKQDRIVGKEMLKKLFFYTMVSNYSLYAYNSLDIPNEWESKDNNQKDEENCWLHRVFHKNDGYQTPLSLHPYRSYGNIDMNREKFLSMQRLLSLMVHPRPTNLHSNPFRTLNDKKAELLELEDIGYSKLQKITITDFFLKHRDTNLLQEDIAYLEEQDSKEKDMWISNAINLLSQIYQRIINHPNNNKLFCLALEYAQKNDLLSKNSDVHQLIKTLTRIQEIENWADFGNSNKKILKELEKFQSFNLCQIQRLELIDAVCDCWKQMGLELKNGKKIRLEVTPELIFKPYGDMTNEEKCKHYIIYKTIAIFETYSTFGYPCLAYETESLFSGSMKYIKNGRYGRYTNKLGEAFGKLQNEWNYKSHITLKLRQAFNYITNGGSAKIYNDKKIWEDNASGKYINLNKISDKYGTKLLDMENLPPAIYKWQIYFRRESDSSLIPFDTLSSGEKQRYFSVGAIIYHLLNIDSIGSGKIHYQAVNLMLEEIELYFHPEWQRSFTCYLMEIIGQLTFKQIRSINVLYVTHSPYILSDIPKTNVLFLKNGEADYSMQENTFGANINGLLKNGFFLPSLPMGEFAHQKINDLFALLHSGDFKASELEKIRQEIQLVGEPVIRQQLMMLYNTYKRLNQELDDNAFRNFIIKKLEE